MDADHVREFTVGAGQPCPDRPEHPMTAEEVGFIAKMMMDEIMELMATVHGPMEAKDTLKRLIDESKDIPKLDAEPTAMIAEQADALVDCYYYALNAACKKGINLSSVFGVVHAANMAKRDPETGMFLKREDGKIIKPPGWQPPDIEAEIRRQMKFGSWNTL